MSLRLFGIDPQQGAENSGVDRFAAEGSLVDRFSQGQGYGDRGGAVGVGPITGSTATPDSGAVRVVTGQAARGAGLNYRPANGLPPVGVLEYVQKFSTATLAAIGLLVLLIVVVRSPRHALRWIARSGTRRAGLE
ncbi:MAG TPA: hypothetical protein VIM33_04910 [Gaiellaceae bacterium]|jgi:hypothetical protein